MAVDYPTGTEILCPECRRVLLRLNRDLWAGDILHSVDVDQVDAPEHGVGAAVACPEHGILDRYTTIARRPDGTEKVGI